MFTEPLDLRNTHFYPRWLNIHLLERRLWSRLSFEFLPDSGHLVEIF